MGCGSGNDSLSIRLALSQAVFIKASTESIQTADFSV